MKPYHILLFVFLCLTISSAKNATNIKSPKNKASIHSNSTNTSNKNTEYNSTHKYNILSLPSTRFKAWITADFLDLLETNAYKIAIDN